MSFIDADRLAARERSASFLTKEILSPAVRFYRVLDSFLLKALSLRPLPIYRRQQAGLCLYDNVPSVSSPTTPCRLNCDLLAWQCPPIAEVTKSKDIAPEASATKSDFFRCAVFKLSSYAKPDLGDVSTDSEALFLVHVDVVSQCLVSCEKYVAFKLQSRQLHGVFYR